MAAAAAHASSKGMYSWWWNSHISPKNSKWLQENLTDMDTKVSQMIKLIEEDADSFARRAEMYYKKRPELMKLVEEFYRAYRALAERYDHATSVLRQAHKTMAEAFPNQVPSMLLDDSPASESDPRTPEVPFTGRSLIDLEEFNKDLGNSNSHILRRNGAFTEESDSVVGRKGFKQFNDAIGFAEGKARRGLNFHGEKGEMEIENLKKAIAELEAEKEAGRVQYQQSLERSSDLELELSRAQEECEKLKDRARQAEAEVETLKELLAKLEAEKKANLIQYEQCLEKISGLEKDFSSAQNDALEFNERASRAETESAMLKLELLEVKAEKEAALAQYKESMENISGVEEKLMQAEEDMRRVVERANNAESAVESLKEEIAKLAAEKEAVAMRCNECLETISNLKCEISVAQEETKRLNTELVSGVEKLKGVEERCVLLERSNQTLHSELESLAQKSASQSQELSEKQQELGQLWAGIQEERLRFVEAETAFQTLQHLHSQSQEELRSLAAQLQNRNQLLNEMEVRNQGLQDEFLKAHEENKNLNELNLSSSLSIKSLQEEIVNLREMIQKLEAEIELRIDERNALQQEIYCLKEELNDLNKKHHLLLDQVDRVGLDPNSLGQSVKELQDENSELKLTCERDASEKAILLQKLAAMDKLLEKNILLENSLSDLNVELEGVREKVNSLEESCQSLLREKSNLVFERDTLVSKLQVTTEYSQELEEKNKILENSLSDANTELEESRVISKSLEESCLLLGNEKSALIMEKENLLSELDSSQRRMENLETRHKELHEKSSLLETERVSFLNEILELKNILDVQRTENACLSQQSKARLADMGSQLLLMQQQLQSKDNEYKEELDKNIIFQIEMFILHNSILDLKDQNSLLTLSCQKLVEASKFSEERVSHLEHENFAQQTELNTLSDEINVLRMGLHQISEMLEMGAECGFEYDLKQGQALLDPISCKVRDLQGVLFESEEENLRIYVEKLVLHTVLLHRDLDVADLMAKMKTLEYNHRIQSERFVMLKAETQKVLEYSEDLGLKVLEGVCREDVLRTEMKILHEQLLDVQGAFQNLKEENHLMLQENRCLSNDILLLREEKCALEEENATIFNETIFEASNHLVFRSIIPQKLMELKELNEVLSKLHLANIELEDKLKWTEQSLENMLTENLHLKGLVEKSESDLMSIRSVNDQLNSDIANKKEVLCQLETKLLEAEQVVNSVETMKAELEKEFKHLKTDYAEIQITGEDQKKQILKLSEDYKQQSEEAESLREAKQQVEVELSKLLQEHDDQKVRGLSMYLELERQSDEIVQWEEQAMAVLRDLIFSNVHEALLEEKIRDLSQACESLTESKFAELEQLKERVSTLEGQNKGLNSKLAGYRLDIASLEKAVSSLESLTGLSKELGKAASEDKCTDDAQEAVEEITCTVADGSSAMQILLRRIQTIEEALLEMRRAATLEKSSTHAKLEAAMEEIERLKSISSLDQENSRASQHVPENLCDGAANHVKPKIEISEAESELLTKDIMLDQISECSSYGISKRGTVEADDQMLEFSESTGKNGSTDLKVGKVQKGDILQSDFQKVKVRRENRSLNPSAESLVEKELDIDKISGTGSFSSFQSQGGNKKKVLERLDSDALKLTNLQITVKDLMRKVASTEKARNGKGLEYDVVKGQLEEAELEIKNLLETNQKLVKNVDDGFFSTDTKSSKDFDSGGNISRRRISEQARRGYERIGRLQLEVQKIQLLLLKLDEEKESRGKARMLERRTRVLLRDYLYGGGRSNQNGKKAPFCSCMQPPTKGD